MEGGPNTGMWPMAGHPQPPLPSPTSMLLLHPSPPLSTTARSLDAGIREVSRPRDKRSLCVTQEKGGLPGMFLSTWEGVLVHLAMKGFSPGGKRADAWGIVQH